MLVIGYVCWFCKDVIIWIFEAIERGVGSELEYICVLFLVFCLGGFGIWLWFSCTLLRFVLREFLGSFLAVLPMLAIVSIYRARLVGFRVDGTLGTFGSMVNMST